MSINRRDFLAATTPAVALLGSSAPDPQLITQDFLRSIGGISCYVTLSMCGDGYAINRPYQYHVAIQWPRGCMIDVPGLCKFYYQEEGDCYIGDLGVLKVRTQQEVHALIRMFEIRKVSITDYAKTAYWPRPNQYTE